MCIQSGSASPLPFNSGQKIPLLAHPAGLTEGTVRAVVQPSQVDMSKSHHWDHNFHF